MTTQQPGQPGQPIQIDPLSKLVQVDLPADIKRLKSTKMSTEQVQSELTGTVMYYLRSLGEYQIQVRDWATTFLFGIQGHLESIEDRLDELESDQEQGTQVEQEDADRFLMFIAGARFIIEETMKTQPDPEAKQKLQELLDLGASCEATIRENVLIEVPEDEDEEDEEEGDEEEEEEQEPEPVQ